MEHRRHPPFLRTSSYFDAAEAAQNRKFCRTVVIPRQTKDVGSHKETPDDTTVSYRNHCHAHVRDRGLYALTLANFK